MCLTDDTDFSDLVDSAVGNQEKALELLKAKPDLINRRNRLGETALHFLVIENFPEAVQFLCSHGADVNAGDFSGATPLLNAAKLEYMDIVRILLSHGADPTVADNCEETPLSWARFSGNRPMIELLVSAGAKEAPPLRISLIHQQCKSLATSHLQVALV